MFPAKTDSVTGVIRACRGWQFTSLEYLGPRLTLNSGRLGHTEYNNTKNTKHTYKTSLFKAIFFSNSIRYNPGYIAEAKLGIRAAHKTKDITPESP